MDEDPDSWPQEDCFAQKIADGDGPPGDRFAPETLEADTGGDVNQGPYGSLDRERNEIRLVEILPGNPSDPIRCRISSFALEKAPKYTALSYTWGRADPDCAIELNGHLMPARKNLWRFLHQIRKLSAWRSVKFWIDAVCINQSNSGERTHQVGLMGQIYSGAVRVLAWLGPAYAHAGLAFRALRSANERPSRKFWWRSEGSGLRRLCERLYWTRLWVVQELVLAKETSLLCGAERLPLGVLFNVINGDISQIRTYRQDTNHELEATINSPAASMIRQIRQARDSDSLWNQIFASARLGCSEPRDKVFALLSIAGHGHEQIVPDYDLELSDVLNNVLRNEHHRVVPESLTGIKDQCTQLANAVGAAPTLVFSRAGFDHVSAFDFDLFPLRDRLSGLSLWWGLAYKHETMQKLWLKENSSLAVQTALSHAARLGEENLCRTLLDFLQHNIVDTTTAEHGNFGQHHKHPLIEAASAGHLNTAKLMLPLWSSKYCQALVKADAHLDDLQPVHASFARQALLEDTFKSCFDHDRAETALALFSALSPDTDFEGLSAFVRTAASHGDIQLIQAAFEAVREGRFYARNVDFLAHTAIRNAMDKDQDVIRALLSGVRMLRQRPPWFMRPDHEDGPLPENDYKSMLSCSIAVGLTKQACGLIERSGLDVNSPYGYLSVCRVCDPRSKSFQRDREKGITPLKDAIQSSDVAVVEAMLSRGNATVDTDILLFAMSSADNGREIPWDRRRQDCDDQIVEILLERCPNVREDAAWWRDNLWRAIADNKPGLVRSLLQHRGANFDLKESRREPALTFAVGLEFEKVVQVLLGVPDLDINQISVDSMTALMKAATHCKPSMVKLLLGRRDLDPATMNKWGASALTYAVHAACPDSWVVVKLLLWHEPTATPWSDHEGNELVRHVISRGRFDSDYDLAIIKALLESGHFNFEFEVRMMLRLNFECHDYYDAWIWPKLGADEKALDAENGSKRANDLKMGTLNEDEVVVRCEYCSEPRKRRRDLI